MHLLYFNPTPPSQIYPLSLHDALPISAIMVEVEAGAASTDEKSFKVVGFEIGFPEKGYKDKMAWNSDREWQDRKSTRLNSSHSQISYAVFCLKKKKDKNVDDTVVVTMV